MGITIELHWIECRDGENYDVIVAFPAKVVVCRKCGGTGRMMRPSLAGYAYTEEEVGQMSHEEIEEMQKGPASRIFGTTCDSCNGKNVEVVPNRAAFTANQRTEYRKYLKFREEQEQSDREWAAEQRTQALMGGMEY